MCFAHGRRGDRSPHRHSRTVRESFPSYGSSVYGQLSLTPVFANSARHWCCDHPVCISYCSPVFLLYPVRAFVAMSCYCPTSELLVKGIIAVHKCFPRCYPFVIV